MHSVGFKQVNGLLYLGTQLLSNVLQVVTTKIVVCCSKA